MTRNDTATARLARGLLFLGMVGAVLWALFTWRDSRVETLLDEAQPGDVLRVGTDVCSVLRERGLVAGDTDCGYRKSVEVRLLNKPD